ncbi:hypothetical protein CHS0354_005999 [Potamilus streckersoni]|uniref:PR domain zinc finger protein 13 n=1 Tax=Potamilus streckersoni TaxID=2493646 RepID=A0AAE0VGQ4_9BIVA|nr:hypothetical protein CHS0354_005999 [Potamilus streckersoni]
MYEEEVKPDEASVVTVTDISAGIKVGPFPNCFSTGHNVRDFPEISYILEVEFRNGFIQPLFSTSKDWIRYMQPARDRHEQNVSLYKTDEGNLFICTIRPISRGEQLLIWYSDGMARECNVPVLFLNNIKGSRCYACTHCGKEFVYPNTLKSHLMFRCRADHKEKSSQKRASPDIFGAFSPFMKRDTASVSYMDHRRFESSSYSFPGVARALLTGSLTGMRSDSLSSLIAERNKRENFITHVPTNLPYQPVSCTKYENKEHINDNDSSKSIKMFPTKLHCTSSTVCDVRCCGSQSTSCCGLKFYDRIRTQSVEWPDQTVIKSAISSSVDDSREPMDLLHKSFITLSTEKGHLCMYCGKYYSRKYGLKIHLRTHTGYKPLKCKVCFRAFGDPSNLNKHVRLHSDGDTPYRCDQCGKILVRRRDLERHVKSRHPLNMQDTHDTQEKDMDVP